jgi:hypothetical protein
MTQDEFIAWVAYFREFPFDDFHRYHRPASAVAASMGADTQKVLDYLAPRKEEIAGYSAAELNTFKAFGFTPPPRKP